MNKSEELFSKAKNIFPGGVNSPVRAFKAVGGSPIFIESAEGCKVTDVDGNKYIDYIGSWGPMILGHSYPDISRALMNSIPKGTSFGTPCEAEIDLAEEIIQRIPSVEMLRFVNSGTEATMSAIRLARAYTQRDIIIKFAGGYHGHADSFLIQAGSGAATFSTPDSPGVTKGAAKDTLIAQFNDLESVQVLFDAYQEGIAAVILEPIPGNMGVVPPEPGFLEGVKAICGKYRSLLIFDEVMCGFRVHPAGAQGLYGIDADLTTMGKIIGGGMPVGAYGGRADIMRNVSPEGQVYQAGTLSGNPMAMAAGLATLKGLIDSVYEGIGNMANDLEVGINDLIKKTEVEAIIQRVGSMLTLFFAQGPIRNFNDALNADHSKFAEFFNSMLKNGVLLPPSGFESWFISAAHDSEVIDNTLDAVKKSFDELN